MIFSGRLTVFRQTTLVVLITFLFLVIPQPPLPAENQSLVDSPDKDVPYVPTPEPVVDRMLEMADVKAGDYVIDLGSGDGRIVIDAAKRGAMGHGIDIDPTRVSEARSNASIQDVSNRVLFERGDIFEKDFSRASVITMYLLPDVNKKLKPQLLNQLEPGTRIVSHDYGMGNWDPDRHETLTGKSLTSSHDIYYWVVPAQVEGVWTSTVDGRTLRFQFDQEHQKVEASLAGSSADVLEVREAFVHGERVEVEVSGDGVRYLLNGRVQTPDERKRITGTVQVHRDEESDDVQNWNAERAD
jgi:SAM-dependent methyltransferase